MNIFLFSHARTALKFGLKTLDVRPGSEILIPDFICDVILEPLESLGIIPTFYSLFDDLSPDWKELENLVNNETRAILMVHYFGRAQDIKKFEEFVNKYKLYLIEDNAHGFGGRVEGKLLGEHGHIGILSPSKSSTMLVGGVLLVNDNGSYNLKIDLLPEFQISYWRALLKRTLKFFPRIKQLGKKWLKTRPAYGDPYAFHELSVGDFRLDRHSKELFNSLDWKSIQCKRYNAYCSWYKFAEKYNLQPVFESLASSLSPLCFPIYVANSEEAEYWFDWGWKRGYYVYSWPALPIEVIEGNEKALGRWRRLVCFSTDSAPCRNLIE